MSPLPITSIVVPDIPMEDEIILDHHQTLIVHAEPSAPPPCHPQARVGAFNVYNGLTTLGSESLKIVPNRGPLVQAFKPNVEKFLEDFVRLHHEPMVPLQCGKGCSSLGSSDSHPRSSLLGPEFIDYVEEPSFPSKEMVSIASDLNNIAWIRSGLNTKRPSAEPEPYRRLL